jgi:hypothetical protein
MCIGTVMAWAARESGLRMIPKIRGALRSPVDIWKMLYGRCMRRAPCAISRVGARTVMERRSEQRPSSETAAWKSRGIAHEDLAGQHRLFGRPARRRRSGNTEAGRYIRCAEGEKGSVDLFAGVARE